MRIRSIKPEFWRSSSISCLEIEDRLLFIGLWSYVDDNGVGIDRDALIAADLFADDISRDPRETFARVSRGLARLSEAKRITRYEAGGHQLLAITGWSEHQRIDKPAKARYLLPTSPDAVIRETLARPSRNVARPSRLEQGNRGTGEQGNREQPTHFVGGGAGEVALLPEAADASTAVAVSSPKTTKGKRLPEDWTPARTTANEKAEADHGPDWLRRQLDRFRDHWAAQSGTKGVKADWDATWRNWIRRATDFEPKRTNRMGDLTNNDWSAMAARLQERSTE